MSPSPRVLRWLSIVAVAALCGLGRTAASAEEPTSTAEGDRVDFVAQIQPLLEQRCLGCHGAEKQRGDLRLDRRETALKGGESGVVFEPGKSEGELLRRISSDDEDERMPPDAPLDQHEIDLLRRWIAGGAEWPADVHLTAKGTPAAAPTNKFKFPKTPSSEGVAIQPAAWATAPDKPATSREIDDLLNAYLKAENIQPLPELDMTLFMKRLSLDVTGKLSDPEKVGGATRSKSPHRDIRTYYATRLLESDDFNTHWARWMRDVIEARATYSAVFLTTPRHWALEQFLYESMRDHRSWGEITHDLLTATGGLYLKQPTRNGAAGFFQCHQEVDRIVEATNDTARVFLGINMQCAQCHDHPNDVWKRQQFHELGAFFARTGNQVDVNDGDFIVYLVSEDREAREYNAPGQYDATQTTLMQPRLFTGGSVGPRQTDLARREALAKFITSRDNYYFSAAFVNRVWTKLMGWGFHTPVENLGPLQQPAAPEVLLRLAAHFRATNYDVRELYKLILSTDAYARQTQLTSMAEDPARLGAVQPRPLQAEALWDCVNLALGGPDLRLVKRHPYHPLEEDYVIGYVKVGRFTLQNTLYERFNDLFKVDTMRNPCEVDPTVPQALLMMNCDSLSEAISATGDTALARLLAKHREDDEAIAALYEQVFSRKPTGREASTCIAYIAEVRDRGAAFEDILWGLVNSTEFRTHR